MLSRYVHSARLVWKRLLNLRRALPANVSRIAGLHRTVTAPSSSSRQVPQKRDVPHSEYLPKFRRTHDRPFLFSLVTAIPVVYLLVRNEEEALVVEPQPRIAVAESPEHSRMIGYGEIELACVKRVRGRGNS